jgi:hypothetical protein
MAPNLIELAGPLPPFIRELRNAIRQGLKTNTRRVLKGQPPEHYKLTYVGKTNTVYATDTGRRQADTLFGAEFHDGAHAAKFYKCPYGLPGQYRYMREPLIRGADGLAYYEDDGDAVLEIVPFQDGSVARNVKWRWKVNRLAQIYMPKEYARTIVHMDDIRMERVQEIGVESVLAEGVDAKVLMPEDFDPADPDAKASAENQIRYKFELLWDSINAKRGYSWESNPWTWVLVFELSGW